MIQGIIKRLFRKGLAKFVVPHSNFGYSQFGEDIIIAYLFYYLKINKLLYLDIGANHPRYISNTFYFYERGGSGVCIEPNPMLWKIFKKDRPRDTVLNIGIGVTEEEEADFYLFPYKAHGLSTFSKKEAMHWQEVGMHRVGAISYEKVIKIPLVNINSVIEKYLQRAPDLLSIDVEGMDFEILSSLNFDLYKPKVICAETLLYDIEQKGYKNQKISDLLIAKGYEIYADTRVNTIYCLKELL